MLNLCLADVFFSTSLSISSAIGVDRPVA